MDHYGIMVGINDWSTKDFITIGILYLYHQINIYESKLKIYPLVI